jgi:hypothetical protein
MKTALILLIAAVAGLSAFAMRRPAGADATRGRRADSPDRDRGAACR